MVEFTEQAGAAILLVSEEYRDYAQHSRAEQRFVLTELPCVRESGNAEIISLFRYQPAERIIKEICGSIVTAPGKMPGYRRLSRRLSGQLRRSSTR